jgi:F420-dependent oxidoreductase-like protein
MARVYPPGVSGSTVGMRVALMIEGQEDVTWDDWLALADACATYGFEALFRSDHYLSVDDFRDRGSLDAWGTICGLAAVTRTLRLGTLVSPATFRHPSVLAKLVVTADHLSGGRVELGLGTGWWEPEHETYGFPFPPVTTRMAMLAEQLEIIHHQWTNGSFSFAGDHYRIEGLDARPKPVQRPHPPLIVGGSAGPRSAALAARWADEYNVFHVAPDEARVRREAVARAWEAAGRDPATLRLSLMNGVLIGADRDELEHRAGRLAAWRRESTEPAALLDELARTWIVGTPDEVVARLREYDAAGVDRVMLQHHLHRDLAALELIGREVIPAVSRG